MTTSTLVQQGRMVDVLDDWLKRDRFCFYWLVWTTTSSHCLWQLVAGLLVQLSLRRGTPTDWQVPILKVLIFSQRCVNAC